MEFAAPFTKVSHENYLSAPCSEHEDSFSARVPSLILEQLKWTLNVGMPSSKRHSNLTGEIKHWKSYILNLVIKLQCRMQFSLSSVIGIYHFFESRCAVFYQDLPKKKCSRRSKFFYSCGHSLFTITHFLCAKTKELPFPFGQLAANTEDTLGPWIQPVVGSVEGLGLNLLSIADYQLSLIGNVAEYISPSTSVLFEKAQKLEDFSVKMPDMVISTVDKLQVRGVTGSIADLWVKYEAELNGKTDVMLRMAEKVPFLSPIASVVNSAVSPFAGMVSDWMLKHSEGEVKEVPPDDTVAKNVTDGPIDDSVHEAGNDSQFLERIEPLTKNHDAAVSIEEQHSDNILQEDNEASEVAEEGIGMPIQLQFVETSPDPILELFDASWHMGSSIIFPKTGPSPKKKADK